MAAMVWTADYEIGVGQIDAEHRWLIDMLNTAHAAARAFPNRDALNDLRDSLQAYATIHFATEESLMEQTGYPDTLAHITLHRFFTDYIRPDKLNFEDEDNQPDMAKAVTFLTEWLLHHIMKADKELGVYLKSQGVS